MPHFYFARNQIAMVSSFHLHVVKCLIMFRQKFREIGSERLISLITHECNRDVPLADINKEIPKEQYLSVWKGCASPTLQRLLDVSIFHVVSIGSQLTRLGCDQPHTLAIVRSARSAILWQRPDCSAGRCGPR